MSRKMLPATPSGLGHIILTAQNRIFAYWADYGLFSLALEYASLSWQGRGAVMVEGINEGHPVSSASFCSRSLLSRVSIDMGDDGYKRMPVVGFCSASSSFSISSSHLLISLESNRLSRSKLSSPEHSILLHSISSIIRTYLSRLSISFASPRHHVYPILSTILLP